MRTLFYLSENQLERIKPFFPRSHGALRVDDRRVVSDIIYVIKHGLQWKDVPDEYRPHRSLYNRLVRWSKRGVFKKISISCQIKRLSMAPWCSTPPTLRLTARRQVYSKRGFSTSHLPNKRRPKFQTSCRLWRAWAARPVFAGWRTVQHLLPDTCTFLADGGYDASWLQEPLRAKRMTVCIPPRRTRNIAFSFDKTLCKRRHFIENTFSKLKDWRRIATRYDRCAHTFFQPSALLLPLFFILINESWF